MTSYNLKQWFYVKRPDGRVSEQHYALRESVISPTLAKNERLFEGKNIGKAIVLVK